MSVPTRLSALVIGAAAGLKDSVLGSLGKAEEVKESIVGICWVTAVEERGAESAL